MKFTARVTIEMIAPNGAVIGKASREIDVSQTPNTWNSETPEGLIEYMKDQVPTMLAMTSHSIEIALGH